ncbi:MAG TPA: YqaE/Pmp3 family membrane protein [Xanthobacteraceae bacterium]|nr:YqaE/Pmp3 family membrane protein [Xanthobacteraceae bacterium]
MQVGFGGHFWLNILLTLFGYIPGIIHAIWVIAKK